MTRTRKIVVSLIVTDGSSKIKVQWFNRPDLKKKFAIGKDYIFTGTVSYYRGYVFINPLYEEVDSEHIYTEGIIPVYPLTAGLKLWELRRAVIKAWEICKDCIEEVIPLNTREYFGILEKKEALKQLHFPVSMEVIKRAKRTLIFEEALRIIYTVKKKKIEKRDVGKMFKRVDISETFVRNLPFKLTENQNKVISEINTDLLSGKQMRRLLHGDVGAGKTVVAMYTVLRAIENGFQAAIMAPTEVLAFQHYMKWKEVMENLGIRISLLTGSTGRKEAESIVSELEIGDMDIVVGTHALISDRVNFSKLGLVVIDEQHRFGVIHRLRLVKKGLYPHLLVMSATPIPRTLMLTLYGDLDVSFIKELPQGRKLIKTSIDYMSKIPEIMKFVLSHIQKGEQAYFIAPVIEENETLKSVNDIYEIARGYFEESKIGILHGRLNPKERESVMQRFVNNQISILIATTVIEVGVDVKNASVMLIFHPERFGLSQLHQLRGRIGRGNIESYCILVVDKYLKDETWERLTFFARTPDGFLLSEKDLEIRGPGIREGLKQHGTSRLEFLNIIRDKDIIEKVSNYVEELLIRGDKEIIDGLERMINKKKNVFLEAG